MGFIMVVNGADELLFVTYRKGKISKFWATRYCINDILYNIYTKLKQPHKNIGLIYSQIV